MQRSGGGSLFHARGPAFGHSNHFMFTFTLNLVSYVRCEWECAVICLQ